MSRSSAAALLLVLGACATTPNDPFAENVALDFSGCSAPPTWAAYREGSGDWVALPISNGVAQFPRPEGAFSVALARASGSVIQVLNATAGELAELDRAGYVGDICRARQSRAGRHQVEIALQGLRAENDWYAAMMDGQTGWGANDGEPAISIDVDDVSRPVADVLVAAWGADGGQPRWALRRDAVTDQQLPILLDLMGDESFRPSIVTVPLRGADLQSLAFIGGTSGVVNCELGTSMVPIAGLGATVSEARDAFTMSLIPSDRLRATEIYVQSLSGFSEIDGVAQGRWIQRYVMPPFPHITLPPALPPISVTALSGPYPRNRFEVVIPAEYRSISIFTRGDRSGVQLLATAGYLEGRSVDLELPDFSAVDGWSDGIVPAAASELTAQAYSTDATFFGSSRCRDRSLVFYSAAIGAPPATPSLAASARDLMTNPAVGQAVMAGRIDWNATE